MAGSSLRVITVRYTCDTVSLTEVPLGVANLMSFTGGQPLSTQLILVLRFAQYAPLPVIGSAYHQGDRHNAVYAFTTTNGL